MSARRRVPARSSASAVGSESLETRTLLTAVQLTDREQLLLELINRARANPDIEVARLGIDLNEGLQPGTITSVPKQPLVPDQILVDVARAHSQDMLDRDYFEHFTLGTTLMAQDRTKAAGYTGAIGENICWGGNTRGINEDQHVYDRHDVLVRSATHRRNIMYDAYEEIGVGVRYGQFTSGGNVFNASMVTEDFSIRNVDPYITGVVYADTLNNDFYDIGESIRSGKVTAVNPLTGAVVEAEIGNSGCYALMVSPGKWVVSAQYEFEGKPVHASRVVTVGKLNIKADFERFTDTLLSVKISANTTTLIESAGVTSSVVTVNRAEADPFPLTLTVSCSDATEITAPPEITIPAGETSMSFTVNALSDNRIDPGRQTSVLVSAKSYAATTLQFTVNDRTTPLLPAGTQTVNSARPTFTWSAVSNAKSYEVWIDNATTKQSRVIFVSGISTASWTADRDLGLGTYNVWVRAATEDGLKSLWSPTGVWRTRPTGAISNSGSIQKSNAGTLEWAEIPGAVSYDLWVDNLTARQSQYFRATAVVGTSLSIPDIAVGKFGVWIRGRNNRGDLTPWGAQGIINVSHAVQGVRIVAADFDAVPELQWNAQRGAVAYEVWIDNKTTGKSAFYRNTSVTSTSVRLSALGEGSFRGWIRGRDATGVWHQWSTVIDFEIRRPSVILKPGPATSSAWPLYQWSTIAGAVAWDFLLQTSDGETLVSSKGLVSTSLASKDNLRAGQYRVWLTAVDSRGVTLSSGAFTFNVTRLDQSTEDQGYLKPIEELLAFPGPQLEIPPVRTRTDESPVAIAAAGTVPMIDRLCDATPAMVTAVRGDGRVLLPADELPHILVEMPCGDSVIDAIFSEALWL